MSKKSQHFGTALMCMLIVGMAWGFHVERKTLNERLETFIPKTDFGLELIGYFTSNTINVNSDGKVMGATPSAAKLFGYTADEMKGKPIAELMPEAYRSKHTAGFTSRMSDPKPVDPALVFESNCEGLKKDGTTFRVEIKTRLKDSDAGRIGMSMFTEARKIIKIQ